MRLCEGEVQKVKFQPMHLTKPPEIACVIERTAVSVPLYHFLLAGWGAFVKGECKQGDLPTLASGPTD